MNSLSHPKATLHHPYDSTPFLIGERIFHCVRIVSDFIGNVFNGIPHTNESINATICINSDNFSSNHDVDRFLAHISSLLSSGGHITIDFKGDTQKLHDTNFSKLRYFYIGILSLAKQYPDSLKHNIKSDGGNEGGPLWSSFTPDFDPTNPKFSPALTPNCKNLKPNDFSHSQHDSNQPTIAG